jgi:predicted dehydrogenase
MKQILVIGGGSIGERHVRCFQQTERVNVALCELSNEVRQRVGRQYELQRCFEKFEDVPLLDFDAAVICTPAHLHIPMAVQLADAGVGILIEKPLSISLDGVTELEALVAAKQLPVSVAYVTRHHPALQAMKQAIDAGRFGKPVQIVANGGQYFPFYRPAYRDTYYTRHETGGGAIQDAITHTMNAAEWLVGPIDSLVADAQHCVLEGVDVEDTVHMLTRHGNGRQANLQGSSVQVSNVLGSFSLNQHQSVNESSLTVICEDGIARMESHHCRWMSGREPNADWIVESEYKMERDDLFVRQASAFLDQLDGTAEPACTLAEGLQTLKVNLAALESVQTGKWIKI